MLGRLTTTWQGVAKRRHGADALLDVIEQLQGAPLAASLLETEILPARIDAYDPADLDAVASAGEVVWTGVEPLGDRDGALPSISRTMFLRPLPPGVGSHRSSILAKPASSNIFGRTARRSSVRCTRRSAAATRTTRSVRSGTSCGRD